MLYTYSNNLEDHFYQTLWTSNIRR